MALLGIENVRKMVRAKIKRAGGQKHWARLTGIERTNVSSVLSGQRPPSKGLLKALGLRKVIAFEKIKEP
jgi:hypothetical protein